jgi:hypothetical protein
VIDLVACPLIRRCTNEFMNAGVWEHCTLDSKSFDVARFTTFNSIIIANFVLTLASSYWFENIISLYFGTEILTEFSCDTKLIQNTLWYLSLSCAGACTFRNITPAAS